MSSESHAGTRRYVIVYGLLIALLTVSIPVTLYGSGTISSLIVFGIAGAKAYLVLRDYMHLKLEPRFITIILLGCTLAVVYMFFFLVPDIVWGGAVH